MKIRIDGIECEAAIGEYILEVAKRNNIHIPSLCHDEALPGQACCRICIVEVIENSLSKVVTSCVYPVTREIDVITNSEKIKEMRKTIIMLLSARAPENNVIKNWAKLYEVSSVSRFKMDVNEECVLCNLCVSACDKLGTSAISTVNRGITKKISTPYEKPSPSCIGCGACANVCPTGAIKILEEDGKRVIWNKEFELVKCSKCDEYFATYEELNYANERLSVKLSEYGGDLFCDKCRKSITVEQLKNIYGCCK